MSPGDVIDLTTPTSASGDWYTAIDFALQGDEGTMFEIFCYRSPRAIITNSAEIEAILMPGQILRILEVRNDVVVSTGTHFDQYVIAVIDDLP